VLDGCVTRDRDIHAQLMKFASLQADMPLNQPNLCTAPTWKLTRGYEAPALPSVAATKNDSTQVWQVRPG